MRRRPAASAAAVLVMLAAGLLAAGGSLAAPARLVSDAPAWDFGSADETETLSHDFTIRNPGTAQVRIASVETGCGCTTTHLSGTVVPPGGTVVLTATLDLTARRGAYTRTIFVRTDVPLALPLTLTASGTVTAVVDVIPHRLDFMDLDETRGGVRTVELVVTEPGTSVGIREVAADVSFLEPSVETVEPGRRHRLRVRVLPPPEGGISRGTVTVTTDHPRYRALKVPVMVRVVGDLVAVPSVLDVPAGNATVAAVAAIRTRDGRPFRVLKVETPAPGILVGVVPVGPSACRLEISGLSHGEDLDGSFIRVVTDAPSGGEILIPLRLARGR